MINEIALCGVACEVRHIYCMGAGFLVHIICILSPDRGSEMPRILLFWGIYSK